MCWPIVVVADFIERNFQPQKQSATSKTKFICSCPYTQYITVLFVESGIEISSSDNKYAFEQYAPIRSLSHPTQLPAISIILGKSNKHKPCLF